MNVLIFEEMARLCLLILLQPIVMMETLPMEMDETLLAQWSLNGLVLVEIQVQQVLVLISVEMDLLSHQEQVIVMTETQ